MIGDVEGWLLSVRSGRVFDQIEVEERRGTIMSLSKRYRVSYVRSVEVEVMTERCSKREDVVINFCLFASSITAPPNKASSS